MKSRVILVAFMLVSMAFLSYPGNFQDSEKDDSGPSTLDEYHFVARGKMKRERGTNPQQIVRMDNNGEILIACVEAKSIKHLEASGIKLLRSQLELLVDWNLLAYDRKMRRYKTTVHVYGPEKASAIRELVGTAVEELEPEISTDLVSLKNHLEKTGKGKNMFAILYAYILHSYSMAQFSEEIYQKPQLDADHPFWHGFAWAIYPIKKIPVGVARMPVESSTFYAVSAKALKTPGFPQYFPLAKDIAADNKVDNPRFVKTFSTFGICDDKGALTIPILDSNWSAKLENTAKIVYAKTIEIVDSAEMKELLGMTTQAQAAMYIHYELRYAFLKHLLEKGFIKAPIDFENADKNKPADVSNLVFLMKSAKGEK